MYLPEVVPLIHDHFLLLRLLNHLTLLVSIHSTLMVSLLLLSPSHSLSCHPHCPPVKDVP